MLKKLQLDLGLCLAVAVEGAQTCLEVEVKQQVGDCLEVPQQVDYLVKTTHQLNQIQHLADFLEDKHPKDHQQQHKARAVCLVPLKNLHSLETQIRKNQLNLL